MDKYEFAFNEWHEKTQWVQDDKRFDVLLPWGKHRADVLKEYIEHLEAKCAALAAETHGFKRFFMFAINAAFDGCDITGDQIQEVAKEIGLVRIEPYSAEKHADMSGDPSIMEEGDDFYIMNKTPATDAFLAEVRAQGVDMVIAYHQERADALREVDLDGSFRHKTAALDAGDVAAQLRQGAAQ